MRIDLVPASRVFSVSALLAALVSCGGGGGGGGASGPVPTVPLTASNAQNVGGNVALASAQLAHRSDLFVPLSAQGAAAPRQAYALSRFLAQEIIRLSGQSSDPLSRRPADVQVQPCTSGNITISSDASSVTETFNACSNAPGQSINGAITLSSFASTATSFSAVISVHLTFSATGFADQTFAGTFGVSETGLGSNLVTITISGTNLVLQQGATVENLGNFSFSTTIDQTTSGTSNSVSFMFTSDEIGGTVSVTTLTPFETTPGRTFPHAGAIQITGVAGSTIRVTVNGDETGPTPQVTIQLDANGDGVFELTVDRNWSDFS